MKIPEKKSALHEKPGVASQPSTNLDSIHRIKKKRRKQPTSDELVLGIIQQDKVALSRAITLIESTNPEHLSKASEIINRCLVFANDAIRIGITGVPGVGKSTFIEALGKHLTEQGKKVAVLAVDPTSAISKGSILGDKTRMEALVKDDNAFIRPSPAGDSLGGVARKTKEAIVLCEAAGYEIILIETVGVGQSETAVHSMTDFFLLLKLAGAGDELQGIKRGIMEMADAIVINKADGDNLKPARHAKAAFSSALHLFPPKENGWIPKVELCSSTEKTGIETIWKMIETYMTENRGNGSIEKKRIEQDKFWFLKTIDEQLKLRFYTNPEVKNELEKQLNAIENKDINPFEAASIILELAQS
ncbi:methylmalonyl Co-A mutase-associated GTPase MeaB [Flavobacteriaceae bacterium M23B6Z8]